MQQHPWSQSNPFCHLSGSDKLRLAVLPAVTGETGLHAYYSVNNVNNLPMLSQLTYFVSYNYKQEVTVCGFALHWRGNILKKTSYSTGLKTSHA